MKLSIEDLAIKKTFSDLSSEEKQFVLSQITKEEYKDIRCLLLNSLQCYTKDIETLNINSTVKEKLLVAFKQKYTKQKSQQIYTGLWHNYKNIIKPALSLAPIVITALFITNKYQGNNKNSLGDVDNISLFLNEKTELLKVNTDYASDLIDSNKFDKDSIFEMNKYLRINTEGLHIN
jgi:hypothetical protein